MNASPFAALFWREYCQLRWLWLATLGLGVLASFSLFYSDGPAYDAALQAELATFVTLMMFAVGAGVTAFAGEREVGTDRWLLGRGVPARWQVAAKILSSAVGAILLTLIVGMLLRLTTAPTMDIPIFTLVMLIVSALGHSLFWSVVVGRVLSSAVISLMSMSLFGGLANLISPAVIDLLARYNIEAVSVAMLSEITVGVTGLAVLGAATVLMIRRLERVGSETADRVGFLRVSAEGPIADALPPRGPWGALFWKEFRRWWLPAALSAALLTTVYLTVRSYGVGFPVSLHYGAKFGHWQYPLFTAVGLVMSLGGVAAFADDRRQQSQRFLGHRGLAAWQPWLIKMLLWGGILCVGIALAIFNLVVWEHPQQADHRMAAVCVCLSVFLVGSLSSIVMSQPIVALATTLGVSLFLSGIVVNMLMLGPVMALFALGILGVLLAANWLHRNDWLLGVFDRRSGRRLALSTVLPLGIIYFSASTYRAYEIPIPAASAAEPATLPPPTAREQAVADAYIRIGRKFKESSRWWRPNQFSRQELHDVVQGKPVRSLVGRFVADHESLLPEIFEATRLGRLPTERPWPFNSEYGRAYGLCVDLLEFSADRAMVQRRWREAIAMVEALGRMMDQTIHRHYDGDFWDILLTWATLSGATRTSYAEGVEALKEWAIMDPADTVPAILYEAEQDRATAWSGFSSLDRHPFELVLHACNVYGGWCEYQRRLRLIDQCRHSDLAWSSDHKPAALHDPVPLPHNPILETVDQREPWMWRCSFIKSEFAYQSHRRRVLLIQLAEILFFNEHGRYGSVEEVCQEVLGLEPVTLVGTRFRFKEHPEFLEIDHPKTGEQVGRWPKKPPALMMIEEPAEGERTQ